MIRFLALLFLAAIYGVGYDVVAVANAVAGHPMPVASLDPTLGHPFTRAQALTMLRANAWVYELKVEDVTGMRNGPSGSKIVAFRYIYHSCERTAEVQFVRAEIEGGWRPPDLTPLRQACSK